MTMKGTVICDIDNTISDSRWRDRIAKTKNWDLFHSLAEYDEPIQSTVTELRYLSADHFIVFCTGRTERHRQITLKWIHEHVFPILPPYTFELFMRPNNDFRKVSKIKMEVAEKFGLDKIRLVIDDNVNVINVFRSKNILCHHIILPNTLDHTSEINNVDELRNKVDKL